MANDAPLAERTPTPLAQLPLDASTPAGLLAMAVHAGRPLEYIERLLAVKKEFDAIEAKKAFTEAMAKFKADPPRIVKDKTVGYETDAGGSVGYKHASLGNVVEKIVASLAKQGFSHRWSIEQTDRVKVTCTITHALGHSESVTMHAAPDTSGKKNAIQQVASAVSYLQRYTLLAATGLAVEDGSDDDGHGVGDDERRADDSERQPGGKKPEGKPAYGDDDLKKNLPKWKALIDDRKKTASQIIATVESKATLTEVQKKKIRELMPSEESA